MVDLISRRAAIKAIDDLPNCYNGYSDTYDKAYIIGVLEEVPTIEPKKGKWIEPSREVGLSYDKKAFAECSVCGKKEFLGWDKAYCPNCGAKMDADISEEEIRRAYGTKNMLFNCGAKMGRSEDV